VQDAGLDLIDVAAYATDIAGVDGGREALSPVIGEGKGLDLVLRCRDRQQWAKDLF
jgi:hypothetical protein